MSDRTTDPDPHRPEPSVTFPIPDMRQGMNPGSNPMLAQQLTPGSGYRVIRCPDCVVKNAEIARLQHLTWQDAVKEIAGHSDTQARIEALEWAAGLCVPRKGWIAGGSRLAQISVSDLDSEISRLKELLAQEGQQQ